jgi:uncharacterized protein YlaI
MEKKCSRCGKVFNTDNKPIKSVDADGNPLRIDLCSMCELDKAVEEIMKFKHFSRKEAEIYIFDTMNEALGITPNKKPTTSNKNKKQGFKYIGNEIISNAVVKVVKDNEVCSN